MDKLEAEFIREKYPDLIDKTKVSAKFLSYFYSRKILTDEEQNEINVCKAQEEKADKFYTTLKKKTNGFSVLEIALTETQQSGVLEILKDAFKNRKDGSLNSTNDELSCSESQTILKSSYKTSAKRVFADRGNRLHNSATKGEKEHKRRQNESPKRKSRREIGKGKVNKQRESVESDLRYIDDVFEKQCSQPVKNNVNLDVSWTQGIGDGSSVGNTSSSIIDSISITSIDSISVASIDRISVGSSGNGSVVISSAKKRSQTVRKSSGYQSLSEDTDSSPRLKPTNLNLKTPMRPISKQPHRKSDQPKTSHSSNRKTYFANKAKTYPNSSSPASRSTRQLPTSLKASTADVKTRENRRSASKSSGESSTTVVGSFNDTTNRQRKYAKSQRFDKLEYINKITNTKTERERYYQSQIRNQVDETKNSLRHTLKRVRKQRDELLKKSDAFEQSLSSAQKVFDKLFPYNFRCLHPTCNMACRSKLDLMQHMVNEHRIEVLEDHRRISPLCTLKRRRSK